MGEGGSIECHSGNICSAAKLPAVVIPSIPCNSMRARQEHTCNKLIDLLTRSVIDRDVDRLSLVQGEHETGLAGKRVGCNVKQRGC